MHGKIHGKPEATDRPDVDAEVAEFDEVTPEDEKKEEMQSKALMDPNAIQPIRHPLMVEKEETARVQHNREELALDEELELPNQSKHTVMDSLEADIDELTGVKDFLPINQKGLQKLFKMDALRFQCAWTNIKVVTKELSSSFMMSAVGIAIMIGSIYAFGASIAAGWDLTFNDAGKQVGYTFVSLLGPVGILLFGAAFVCSLIFLVIGFWPGKFEFKTIWAKLTMTPLKEERDRIPYGVKLRTVEAKRTGIFEDFVIAKPEIITTEHSKQIPKFKLPDLAMDPAILGITKDNRMFMVVWWDVEKDIEHTMNLAKFDKYKL